MKVDFFVLVFAEGIRVNSKKCTEYMGDIAKMRAYYQAFEGAEIAATTDLLIFVGTRPSICGGGIRVCGGR